MSGVCVEMIILICVCDDLTLLYDVLEEVSWATGDIVGGHLQPLLLMQRS